MPERPHTLNDDVKRLIFTSVDDCRSSLRSHTHYSRSVLEDALVLAKAYGERTRVKLLQAALRKYDREVQQELQS